MGSTENGILPSEYSRLLRSVEAWSCALFVGVKAGGASGAERAGAAGRAGGANEGLGPGSSRCVHFEKKKHLVEIIILVEQLFLSPSS